MQICRYSLSKLLGMEPIFGEVDVLQESCLIVLGQEISIIAIILP